MPSVPRFGVNTGGNELPNPNAGRPVDPLPWPPEMIPALGVTDGQAAALDVFWDARRAAALRYDHSAGDPP